MIDFMDDISELIYIADIDTYEVYYVNNLGKKAFHVESGDTRKCYEIFQGRTSPCEFCTSPFLTHETNYTWEHTNVITGRHYLSKDRLIEYKGKKARMEIAFDITEQDRKRMELENALAAEKMVMHCVERLHRQSDLTKGISDMLSQLGKELGAQRTYIFEVNENRMSNTFEWCAKGVSPQKENLQQMDTDLIERWRLDFNRDECVMIEDIESIKEISPTEYEILAAQDIRRLVSAPLKQNGKLTGFLGVDNPILDKIRNIAPLLNTLRYFLMATIARIEDEKKLTDLSFRDTLTGLYNRNRYLKDIERFQQGSQALGVVYLDLNGLKEINDKGGHAAGDEALILCAGKIRNVFENGSLYRIGGDEFVIIQLGCEKEAFEKRVKRLRKAFDRDQDYKMAIGSKWSDGSVNVEALILAADTNMYEDKRRFYRTHALSGRYRKFSDNKAFSEENPRPEYNMLMSAMKVSVSKHLVRPDLKVLWANDCFYEMTGYTKEEFESAFQTDCAVYLAKEKEELEKLRKTVVNAFDSGKPGYELLLHLPRKNGSYLWVHVVGTFTEEKIEGVPVVYTVFTDVSDLVRIKNEQSVTYDSLPGFVATMRIAQDGPKLVYGNKQFTSFFGEDGQERLEELFEVHKKEKGSAVRSKYARLREGKSVVFEMSAENAQGKPYQFQVSAGCIDWEQKDPVYLVVFIDITDITRQRAAFEKLAYVDPVTMGPNRSSFEFEAGGAILASAPGSFMLVSLDIQKFKVLNDLFGTAAGDKALKYIYQKIASHLREGEYAARISSDLFSILLKAEDKEKVEARIRLIAEDINSFNVGKSGKYLLTIAAGIYPVVDTSLSMTQLQDRANVARRKIKNNVSGMSLCACQFYSKEDRIRLAKEKEIENKMQDALDRGHFLVYLQPKMDLRKGCIGGGEALVRWEDPEFGLMPPNDFVPLFEKNGFIVELDLYVFDRVCAMLKRWKDQGYSPIPISVNMSRAHLGDPDFLERYERIRKKYGVDASLLEIEITETLVYENPALLSSVIDQIHKCGYGCSMDDFGSGYSSLNVLRNIRVDTLKLDRDFFSEGSVKNPWEAAVIGVVVELASKLGMKTVAEGVETKEQAEFLTATGCDMIQGFLYSRPVRQSEFEKMVFGK